MHLYAAFCSPEFLRKWALCKSCHSFCQKIPSWSLAEGHLEIAGELSNRKLLCWIYCCCQLPNSKSSKRDGQYMKENCYSSDDENPMSYNFLPVWRSHRSVWGSGFTDTNRSHVSLQQGTLQCCNACPTPVCVFDVKPLEFNLLEIFQDAAQRRGWSWMALDWLERPGLPCCHGCHATPSKDFSQGCVDRQTCFFFLSFSFYLKSLEAVKGVILRLDKWQSSCFFDSTCALAACWRQQDSQSSLRARQAADCHLLWHRLGSVNISEAIVCVPVVLPVRAFQVLGAAFWRAMFGRSSSDDWGTKEDLLEFFEQCCRETERQQTEDRQQVWTRATAFCLVNLNLCEGHAILFMGVPWLSSSILVESVCIYLLCA